MVCNDTKNALLKRATFFRSPDFPIGKLINLPNHLAYNSCRYRYDSESYHGSTQKQMFLAWVKSWFELQNRKHFESWVDLNQYLVIHLSHELILSQFMESRLSHKLNRFTFLRYRSSHELIQINLSVSRNPPKRSYEVNTCVESPKGSYQVNSKVECPKKYYESGNE